MEVKHFDTCLVSTECTRHATPMLSSVAVCACVKTRYTDEWIGHIHSMLCGIATPNSGRLLYIVVKSYSIIGNKYTIHCSDSAVTQHKQYNHNDSVGPPGQAGVWLAESVWLHANLHLLTVLTVNIIVTVCAPIL